MRNITRTHNFFNKAAIASAKFKQIKTSRQFGS